MTHSLKAVPAPRRCNRTLPPRFGVAAAGWWWLVSGGFKGSAGGKAASLHSGGAGKDRVGTGVPPGREAPQPRAPGFSTLSLALQPIRDEPSESFAARPVAQLRVR